MTTKTWDGSSDPLSTAADWSPTGAPKAGDDAIVASGTPSATGTLNGYELDLAGATATGQPQLDAVDLTLGKRELLSLGEATGAQAFGTVLAEGVTTNRGEILAPSAGGSLTIAVGDLLTATGSVLTHGKLVNDGSIISTGGTIRIEALEAVPLVNDGIVGVAGGGTVDIGTSITGTGRLVLQGSATLDIERAASAGQTVTFNGSAGTPERLDLGEPGAFRGLLSGLAIGDTIDVPTQVTGSVSGTLLALRSGHDVIASLDIGAGYTTANFTFSDDGHGGTVIGVVCFARGTRLLTASGERRVEALQPGDTVTTLDGRECAIRWVGRRRVDVARHPQPDAVRPVRIAAHAFADSRPHADLLVSPEHALFVDGVLIPAHCLVNGSTVTQDSPASVEYFHVELDRHEVLLAEGMPAESYLDTGNRTMFANAPLVDLHPRPTAGDGAEAAAPLVLQGPRLDAVRARLASRAAALPARAA